MSSSGPVRYSAGPIGRRSGVEHHAALRQQQARRMPPIVRMIAGGAQENQSMIAMILAILAVCGRNVHGPPALLAGQSVSIVASAGMPGLELHLRVGDVDLDAIDQLDPLLLRLHVLRRELGLGGNERHAALVLLAGTAIGGHPRPSGSTFTRPRSAFLDVRPQPDVHQVADGDHGGAGGDVLARLDVLRQHHARKRRIRPWHS